MLNDEEVLALCVYEEARGEIDDGKAAVARIIKNRMKQKFFSDGTIQGTVLRKDQFSWAWFDMVNGKYTRVCSTLDEAKVRSESLYNKADKNLLYKCSKIAQQVSSNSYTGTAYNTLTDKANSYVNLKVSDPNWATEDRFICKIGNHSFYDCR